MRNILSLIFILFTGSAEHAQWNYPPTKMEDSIDNYFGKTITDHYRWMEHIDDKSVQAENRLVTYSNFADQNAFMLWQTGDPSYQLKK